MATTQTEKSDPVVLGVSVPVTVTVTAAKQVGTAWKEFGSELVHALSQARETTKGTIKRKAKKAAAEVESAASSGVNA